MFSALLPFCPKLAWSGKTDSRKRSDSESLKGTLKHTEVRKFFTVENFLRMRYNGNRLICIEQSKGKFLHSIFKKGWD